MNTAHEELAAIVRAGAQRFSTTALASSHAGVTRTVRRHRVVRGSVTAVAGVGIVSAGAFGVLQFRGADAVGPAGTPSPLSSGSPTPSASPVPSAEATQGEEQPDASVIVEPGMRVDQIIALMVEEYGVTEAEAREALAAALPAQAGGEPEGWFAPSDQTGVQDVATLAEGLVSAQELALAEAGVPNDEWRETLIIASLAQAEASTSEDMRGVAAVIENRLAMDMALQLDSTVLYAAALAGEIEGDQQWTTDEQRAADTPYNTYVFPGLPPGPINNPGAEAIAAVREPADEDWLYFIREPETGRVLFASDFEEHLENVETVQAQLQAGESTGD